MDPIQAVNLGSQGASGPTRAGGAEHMSSTSQSQSISIATSSSASMITVSQQVDSLLSSIGPQLADNPYLKLIIAALILNALLGQDGRGGLSGDNGMRGLENLGRAGASASMFSMESSMTVQIQQESSTVSLGGSLSGLVTGADSAEDAGGQLDVSG